MRILRIGGAVLAVLTLVALSWAAVRGGGVTAEDDWALPVGSNLCEGRIGAPTATSTPARPATERPGLDVRTVGAAGDGVTDDAPALRRALAAADSIHVPAGTYLLASYHTPRSGRLDADFVFHLRDNQTITAEPGAILKVGGGVIASSQTSWGGNVFLSDGRRDISISGLTLELNGANNLVPAGRVITAYGLYLYASHHIRLTDVTMRDTPGQNYVVAQGGGEDISVARSTFWNGGTSVPGNTHQQDFSALYLTASDVEVDRVTIGHDDQPFYFSAGIELHGSRQSVTNSTIEKSWPAVYISPDTGQGLQEAVTVSCNRLLDVGRGVVFNGIGEGAIDQVDIASNDITLARFNAFGAEPARAVDQDMPPDGNWTYHHILTGLTIERNLIQGNGAPSDAVIRLSQIHSGEISDNRFEDVSGATLALFSSPWGTKNVSFVRNHVDWLGTTALPAVLLTFSGSSLDPPVAAFTASNITIADNYLAARREQGTCGVYAEWSVDAGVTDISFRDNTLSQVAMEACGSQAAEILVTR